MTRLRIALAQINPKVGDLEGNVAKICAAYDEAELAGCDIVAFPELAITGYPPEDLVLKPGFVADNLAALDRVAAHTQRCAAVVGYVASDRDLYNAAAVCVGGEVVGTYRKRLLDPRGRRTDEQMRVVLISEQPVAHTAPLPARIVELPEADAELYDALVLGTRDYVLKNGFTDVVVALSGGIDSTIVACVAVDALGADHVHGVSMPSRYSSDHSKTDAADLAQKLGIDFFTIGIEPAFAAYLEMTAESFAGRAPDLTEENLQSRIRGTTLMALSNKFGWMVLTTGNKSEIAVGYFTIYGDSVGGYGVIKDVLKTRVYDLCRYVNRRDGRATINEHVITKPPSAELRPDQRDDQSLPPYEVLDPILALYVEDDRTAGEIIEMGHDEAIVRRITRLVDLNEYKRRQCPPGVRVSAKAFGKDRRLPITNGYRG